MLTVLSRPLLTVHEAAVLLRINEATVRAAIHDQSLRAIRIGREWRIAFKDLEAFVNTHATRPPDDAATPQRAGDPVAGAPAAGSLLPQATRPQPSTQTPGQPTGPG